MRRRADDLARTAEWPDGLNFDALTETGWKPHPFRQFVLKLHSRCDLACDHCYVYEMADQRWRTRPLVMSRKTIDAAADRIAEHADSHGLSSVDVTLHGGEPLLAGPDRITHAVRRIRASLSARRAVGPRLNIHTNGVRLTPSYLRLFNDLGVGISVSLDGTAGAHDRHRRRPDGRGSHEMVRRALTELGRSPHRRLFRGLLCTIDPRNPPIATYDALLDFSPPAIDFLLPHGNWSAPPPYRAPGSSATPYADWLIAVFDRWHEAPVKETRIRLFDEIINLLLGGESRVEGIGLSPVAVVVVETDGAIEQSDMLAAAFHGAAATGLNVARDAFDTALRNPGIAARQIGAAALSAGCRSCLLRRVCGGGLYPHRYRAGSGFANPSVYCPDLYRLITHIRDRLNVSAAAIRGTATA